jgi:hypothetical protein
MSTIDEQREVSRAPSPHSRLPWLYRPCKHDDWGWIRRSREDGQPGDLVASVRSGQYESEEALDQHRRDKTDPYAANAAFIVRAVNNHGILIRALEDCDGCVSAAEAEGLHEIITELRGSSELADRLIDLIERRLIYVRSYAQPALAIAKGEA